MKLNDPFGRMERRHQIGYESMKKALEEGGITTQAEVLQVLKASRKQVLQVLCYSLTIALLLALLIPAAMVLFGSVLILVSVLAITSYLNGKRYTRRYIEEELNHHQTPDDQSN